MNKLGRMYNASRKLYLRGIPLFPKIIWLINRIVFSADIPYTSDIHPDVTFSHNGLGVVINRHSKIGVGSFIGHQVTLGGNMGKKRIYEGEQISSPVIGKDVFIGVGSLVLGPVIIGDNAKIGAGSLVLNDVEPFSVAYGVPAKTVKVGTEDRLN